MIAIQNFQQRLYARYKEGLSLPPRYCYLYGNPVQPVIPISTPRRGVYIISSYPPARLATVKSESQVPVADQCDFFCAEPYFDGRQLRLPAQNLPELYLVPLGLAPKQCWPSYLVRLFLFKDEHLARYRRLGCDWPEWETRSRFAALARQGRPWLAEELALARPRLVISLGAEVAAVLQDAPGETAGLALLSGHLQDLWLDESVYPVIHLAGPDRITRPPWAEHLAQVRPIVDRLVRGNAWPE